MFFGVLECLTFQGLHPGAQLAECAGHSWSGGGEGRGGR